MAEESPSLRRTILTLDFAIFIVEQDSRTHPVNSLLAKGIPILIFHKISLDRITIVFGCPN
jgi:hydrogenase-4 membrane subunit HyfE